ncbi:HEAT repeat domain-containing protein [Kitasatospora sp. NPDC088134]|uniref:HEAT repeat domain-containing protein n=1 Tax=Kitasatospora sp. NPDC088134 TaxID=3364071 RepID=UPI003822D64D
MRAPEELHLVDWEPLYHAYGSGNDLPGWIRALYDEDPAVVDEALSSLFNSAQHQGSVYPSAVAAVPYVAHAARHARHRRDGMLAFLAGTGGAEEWEDAEGCARVAEELPGLLPLLRDADPEVRRQAVRVARRAAGEVLPAALAALTECLRADPEPTVRAEALTVLGRIDPDPAAALARRRAALADPEPAVRATAALDLLEQAGTPGPAELLAVLAADGGTPAFRCEDNEWFPGVGTTDLRVQNVLDADPEAAHTVAAAWIAAGDHGGRGTRRALRLVRSRRGREAGSAALLLAALPHQREWYWHMHVLQGLADLAPYLPDPGAAADAVLPHAADPDWRISEPAQRLLGRLGDPRLRTAAPHPDRTALAELAVRTDDLELRRLVLSPAPACGRCGSPHGGAGPLLDALTPADAAVLLPELTALLRTDPDRRLIRRLADFGHADPEILRLLRELAAAEDGDRARAAAVSAARLGADPVRALELLADPAGDSVEWLAEVARLGPAAAPLLPLVEPRLTASSLLERVGAAEALWRITGDPARAVPVLLAGIGPTAAGLRALELLGLLGAALPAEHRARVEGWAAAEGRGPDDPFRGRAEDERLRELSRALLAAQG